MGNNRDDNREQVRYSDKNKKDQGLGPRNKRDRFLDSVQI